MGVVFIDEVYQFIVFYIFGGCQILDIIFIYMENSIGGLVVIFVGYIKDMQSFGEYNSGLESRIFYKFEFEDFSLDELCIIFKRKINYKWGGNMKIEVYLDDKDGDSWYLCIILNCFSCGCGNRGFGNVRLVENQFD